MLPGLRPDLPARSPLPPSVARLRPPLAPAPSPTSFGHLPVCLICLHALCQPAHLPSPPTRLLRCYRRPLSPPLLHKYLFALSCPTLPRWFGHQKGSLKNSFVARPRGLRQIQDHVWTVLVGAHPLV